VGNWELGSVRWVSWFFWEEAYFFFPWECRLVKRIGIQAKDGRVYAGYIDSV